MRCCWNLTARLAYFQGPNPTHPHQVVGCFLVACAFALAGQVNELCSKRSRWEPYNRRRATQVVLLMVLAGLALVPVLALATRGLVRRMRSRSRQAPVAAWQAPVSNAALGVASFALWTALAFGPVGELVSCEQNCLPWPDSVGGVWAALLFYIMAQAAGSLVHAIAAAEALHRMQPAHGHAAPPAAHGEAYRSKATQRMHLDCTPAAFLAWLVRHGGALAAGSARHALRLTAGCGAHALLHACCCAVA